MIENQELKIFLGKQLAALREEIGLKPTELARKVGMSKSYISQIESGKTLMGAELISSLNRTLFVNLNWLFTNQGEKILSGIKPNDNVVLSEAGETEAELRAQVKILQDTLLKISHNSNVTGDVEPMRVTIPSDATIQSGSKLSGAKS